MLTQETRERGRKGERKTKKKKKDRQKDVAQRQIARNCQRHQIKAEVYNSLHQGFYIKKFIPKSLY